MKWILTLLSVNPTTTTNTVEHGQTTCLITAHKVLDDIHDAVTHIGKDQLGFTAADINTHSNRLAAVMSMYLTRVPVFTIILIGIWLLDTFLVYICKQVQDFTKGISSKMLILPGFFTIPDATAHRDDHRTQGDPNSFVSRQNGGNLERNIIAPSFALHL